LLGWSRPSPCIIVLLYLLHMGGGPAARAQCLAAVNLVVSVVKLLIISLITNRGLSVSVSVSCRVLPRQVRDLMRLSALLGGRHQKH
jgi:hypothetical protein